MCHTILNSLKILGVGLLGLSGYDPANSPETHQAASSCIDDVPHKFHINAVLDYTYTSLKNALYG